MSDVHEKVAEVVSGDPAASIHVASNGVPFCIRMVFSGEGYGVFRDGQYAMTHGEEEVLVEFYDARYAFSPHGQFVSRYHLKTLNDDASRRVAGLNLYGGEDEWRVDGGTLCEILAWADDVVSRHRDEIRPRMAGKPSL